MKRRNIEVEIRSFISKEEYDELLKFFEERGKLISKDKQETYYFKGLWDLRIQKNNFYSKIWFKKGKIHDDFREEIEIKFDSGDFNELKKLFDALGYKVDIKWLRTRHTFRWQGITVTVDFTKGYGYIIELEKMTRRIEKEKVVKLLKGKLKMLSIRETPREVFEKKFQFYKKNWEKLAK
ncbi:MAG: CYTH domain-containing protein [Candidatus Moranbacteria bacterium]|nr:CYTH domain-containing protein [Candidatus Moranbacteria bacterium]